VLACLVWGLLASAQSAPFVWVDQVQDLGQSPTGEYTIGIGDLLSIQVWDQEKISARTRVRSDGRISLPFVNDIQAAGKVPVRLASEIESGLRSVILNPRVTVVVEESKPLSISVLGEVLKPGLQTLDVGAGVAQALAAAGGLNAFAHKDRIFVLRSGPTAPRIRFKYEALIGAVGRAPLFRLRSGDVVVVE
jgi:polysaccharide export outer membrane protein